MRWSLLVALFALGLAAAAFAARGGSAKATDGTLTAAVGPGFSISLTQGGSAVTTLPPGTYIVNVSDMSTLHNFHLSGPGVNQATDVATTSTATWSVTLSAGSYHFQCDAHPTMLHGDFTVGSSGGTTSATTAPGTTTAPATTTASSTTSSATTTSASTTAPTTTAPGMTTTAAPSAGKLTARIAKVQASRARVSVTIASSRAGRATADLLDRHGKRVAHLAARVHGVVALTLRPPRLLSPGRYVLRVRIAYPGRTVTVTRPVRIA